MGKSRCSICKYEYKSEKNKPHILRCGHTFCITCIHGFLSIIRKCYTCEKPLTEPLSKLPTNRAILSARSILDTVIFQNGRIQMHIDDEKQYVTKRLEKMNQLSDSLSIYEHVYDRLNYHGPSNPSVLRNRIQGISSGLGSLELMHYSCYKPKINPNFSISRNCSKEQFFRKVMVELYRKKIIYTYKMEYYQSEIYWGKLSYKERQLCIHCFTTDPPPSTSLLVAFRDLEKCMKLDNFRTFINIAADHIVCEIMSSSMIAYDFVKYCTGEEGISFKGSICQIGILTHSGDKYTDITIQHERPDYFNYQNYKFLKSIPRIVPETFEKKLHIAMNENVCTIRKYPTKPFKSLVLDVVPIASAVAFGHIFSTKKTTDKVSPYNIQTIATVKDCGILILPHQDNAGAIY